MDDFVLDIADTDEGYRLTAPDGDCETPHSYSDFSTVAYKGRIAGVFVKGNEPDLRFDDPTAPERWLATTIKVYDFTDFPTIKPWPDARLFIEPTEFDYEGTCSNCGAEFDGLCPECAEGPEEGEVLDVEPVA